MVENQVVAVGRLSPEKGLRKLIDAWPDDVLFPKLIVVGDGPEREDLLRLSSIRSNVDLIGQLDSSGVTEVMARSLATVVPSTWAEPFGRVVIESMSLGVPVIGSNSGGIPEVVGDTGYILSEISAVEIENAVIHIRNTPDLRLSAQSRFRKFYSNQAAKASLEYILNRIARA